LINRPRLVCVPFADAGFALAANTLLARMAADATVQLSSDTFAEKLRLLFPTVVVRERRRLADVWPVEGPVWYVIRREYAERIAGSIEIEVEREDVFNTYVERMPEWQVALRLRPHTTRPGLVGLEYAAVYSLFGRNVNFLLRLVDADPPNAVRVEAEGMGVVLWYAVTFSDTPAGCRVEVAGDYVLPSRLLAALVEPLTLERAIARDIERAHAALRDLCLREYASCTVISAAGNELASQLM